MKCCTSIKLQKANDKFTKKRDQICDPQRRGVRRGRGKGNWTKAVGRYKLPVTTQVSPRDVTHSRKSVSAIAERYT